MIGGPTQPPAILLRMSAWRRSRLARFTVALILAWTAIDITNSWLCSLDGEALPWAAVDVAIVGADSGAQPDMPLPVTGHIDDCFCCSHCVQPGAFEPVDVSLELIADGTLPLPSILRSSANSLDHPPQLLG